MSEDTIFEKKKGQISFKGGIPNFHLWPIRRLPAFPAKIT
jgi:hypothetical protein